MGEVEGGRGVIRQAILGGGGIGCWAQFDGV